MNRPASPDSPAGGPTTGILIVLFGAAEIAILYAILGFDTRVGEWARKAAETWPGRILLSSIGLGVISMTMMIVLSLAERRQRRRDGQHAG